MSSPNSHPISCPLCLHDDARLVESISGRGLAGAWKKSYGIEVEGGMSDTRYFRCQRCQLGFFTPAQAGNAELYERLQQYDWYYVDDKPEYEIAARWLPQEGTVLEVGSGKAAFAGRVGVQRYHGLEFNEAAIQRARSAGIRLTRESIEAHANVHEGAYGAVVSFQVLEHVPDPAGFVGGCVRALEPGKGRLILAVPDHDGLCGLAQNNILDMPPHHVSHWTEHTLRELAKVYGLEVLSIEREQVSDLHVPWAQRALIERRWRRRLGMDDRLLDLRWTARILGRLALHRSSHSTESVQSVSGHTIVGVFKKR